jgi:hypothetical protein
MSGDFVDAPPAVAELTALLEQRERNLQLGLRVAMPANVIAYDPIQQRASVQLGLLPVKYIGGDEVVQAPVLIPGVPVAWPGGSLGYVTTPLLPNDSGVVVFFDRAVAQWLLQGIPTDPVNGRTHNLGDAVFFPGARNTTNPIVPPTSLVATVVEGPQVQLGVGATQHVVLGEALHAYLIAMVTAAGTAALDGGATFKAALLAYLGANPLTSYTATKVMAI